MKKRNLFNSVDNDIPLNIPVMISGCLLGICCRYDGGDSGCSDIIKYSPLLNIIPFCPEQLGGLSTPRAPAEIVGGAGNDVFSGNARVLNESGYDVTDAFIKGARETLNLARITGARIALVKDRSPSCGIDTPYCESGTGSGPGVTAALLKSSGIEVLELAGDSVFPSPEFREAIERSLLCSALAQRNL